MAANIRLDRNFQNFFNSLSSNVGSTRIESSVELLKYLENNDGKNSLGESASLGYSLRRLVSGLSSQRQQARVGYSTALTNILRKFPHVPISFVLKLLEELIKPDPKDSKKEIGDKLVGQILVCTSILQSGRIQQASDEELHDITDRIRSAVTKKRPLQVLVTQTLNLLISKVSSQQFEAVVFKLVSAELRSGWGSADSISILLTAAKYHKNVIDVKFLKKHMGSKKLLADANFKHFVAAVKSTLCHHPLIHPLNEQILQYQPEMVHQVWTEIYEDELLHTDARCGYLCMMLAPSALLHCTRPDQVNAIISEKLVTLMLRQASGKDSILSGAVHRLCKQLIAYSSKCANGALQFTVIKSLISPPGGLQFDQNTKTATLSKIVSELCADGAELLSKYCIDIVCGTESISGHCEKMRAVRWACQHLPLCLNRLVSKENVQLEILRFLLFHSFFSLKASAKKIPNCSEVISISDDVRKLVQQTYNKALGRVAVVGPEKSKTKKHFLNVLHQLTEYVKQLLSAGTAVEMRAEWDDETTQVWQASLKYVKKIRAESEENASKPLQAFQLLLMHLGLNLLVDPDNTVSCLQDLHVCYEKAHGKNNKKKRLSQGEDEPDWVDVMTELLLSFLAQESNLLRTVSVQVFRMLGENLTLTAVGLLVDALTSTGEDDNLAFEDSEEEEDEEEMDENGGLDEEDDDESEEEEEEEEEEDSESENEEEFTVDKDVKESLKAALGRAAGNSDDEDDDEISDEEMDDDEMFKLDDKLAAAFRAMRKGKKEDKEKEKQVLNFKVRILGLVSELESLNVSPSLVLPFLGPLIELGEDAMRDKKMGEFEKRATDAYTTILKVKPITNERIDAEEVVEKLKEMLELSDKVMGLQSVQKIGHGCVMLLKLLMGSKGVSVQDVMSGRKGKEVRDVIKQMMGARLESFCKKENIKHVVLLSAILDKQAELLWPLIDDMLTMLKAEDTKVYAKSKILNLLASLTTRSMYELIGKDVMDGVIEQIMDIACDILSAQVKLEQPNTKLVCELFHLLSQLLPLADVATVKSRLDISEEIEAMQAKVTGKDLRQACNKLASVLRNKAGIEVKKRKKELKRKAENGVEDSQEDSEEQGSEDNDEEEKETKGKKKKSLKAKKPRKEGLASEGRKKKQEKKRKGRKKGLEDVVNGSNDIEMEEEVKSEVAKKAEKKGKKKKKVKVEEMEVDN